MKLNHLNLAVSNVAEARVFLQTYFGFQSLGRESDTMSGLVDEANFTLVLMKDKDVNPEYPRTFHVGFIQQSEEAVNELNRRLRGGGFDVPLPKRMHGSWAFYFTAPGGFMIEVAC